MSTVSFVKVRRIGAMLLAAFALLLQPAQAGAADATWRGEYFVGTDLSGGPVFVRSDANLNFNWGWGSPAGSLPADRFSVRWTRSVDFAAGSYRFSVSVDDGVRLYVDGRVIIDQWRVTAPVTHSATVDLAAGAHRLTVEYFEQAERAQIRMWWEKAAAAPPPVVTWRPPAAQGGWRGKYFNNRNLSGNPAFERDDAFVYFNWGDAGPGGGLGGASFSVRWSRAVDFAGGTYRFRATADDGLRVWLDSTVIIDEWRESSSQTYVVEREIAGGRHEIVVEYFQAGGNARVQLEWGSTKVDWLGNLETCMWPEKSWVKVYRLAPDSTWEDIDPAGFGPLAPTGERWLFGLHISPLYGWDGQPHKVELWEDGQLVRVEGDVLTGQPPMLLQPGGTIRTTWPCGAGTPRKRIMN